METKDMLKRIKEIESKLIEKLRECVEMYPPCMSNNELYNNNREEWHRLNHLHDLADARYLKYWRKTRKEYTNLIIEVNKSRGIYWDKESWVYDEVKKIEQHYELTGQERTREFVKDLEKLNGCVVVENDAGYTLRVYTPYKVYCYGFNRGYGGYPIVIHKGLVYQNMIALFNDVKEMDKEVFKNYRKE